MHCNLMRIHSEDARMSQHLGNRGRIHKIHMLTWISAARAFDKNLTSIIAFKKTTPVSEISKEMDTSFT